MTHKVTYNRERVRKLPKWAQDFVAAQDRAIERLQKQLDTVAVAVPEDASEPKVVLDLGFQDKRKLPDNAQVRWNVQERESGRMGSIEVRAFRPSEHGKGLQVMGYGLSGTLIVRPHCANVITVELEEL